MLFRIKNFNIYFIKEPSLKFESHKYDYLLSNFIQYIDKDGINYKRINRLCSYFILEEDNCKTINCIMNLMNNIINTWNGDWVFWKTILKIKIYKNFILKSVIFLTLYLQKMRTAKTKEILSQVFINMKYLANNVRILFFFYLLFFHSPYF